MKTYEAAQNMTPCYLPYIEQKYKNYFARTRCNSTMPALAGAQSVHHQALRLHSFARIHLNKALEKSRVWSLKPLLLQTQAATGCA